MMKNTILKTIGTAALAILMLAMFAQISVFAQEIVDEQQIEQQTSEGIFQSPRNRQTLEGSWSVQVTFVNCQTGAAIRTSPSMYTFMQGGTMQEFGIVSSFRRGPGHGVWERESGQRYTSAFQFFRFNPDGSYAGKVRTRAEIRLTTNGNAFTATSTAESLSPTDENVVIMVSCITQTATRFE